MPAASRVKPQAPFTLQATLSDKATRSHSFQWRAGNFRRQRAIATVGDRMGRGKFRILQLYANEDRLSGATANGKEDGWAHVIVLLSAVDKLKGRSRCTFRSIDFHSYACECIRPETQASAKIFRISLRSIVQTWWTLACEFASRDNVWPMADRYVTAWPRIWIKRTNLKLQRCRKVE